MSGSNDFSSIRIGTRVRHTDGVEGRIAWANGTAVKIQWDDGEKVTWKRAELGAKGLQVIEDEQGRAPQEEARPAEPAAPEPAAEAAEPQGDDSTMSTQTTAVPGGWMAEVFERTTGKVLFTSAAHSEESAALQEAGHWRSTAGSAKAVVAPAPAKKRRTRQASTDGGTEKKLSALDAAAKVLAEQGKPMGCQELIGAMAVKGYWTSPGGKTPASTLYSALLRELQTKGDSARFVKVGRGQFALRPQS
jgi:hypothetical protein